MKRNRQRPVLEWYALPLLISYIDNDALKILMEDGNVLDGSKLFYHASTKLLLEAFKRDDTQQRRSRIPDVTSFANVCVNVELIGNGSSERSWSTAYYRARDCRCRGDKRTRLSSSGILETKDETYFFD